MLPDSAEISTTLLALKKMNGSHTAQNVYETLENELSSWLISDEKVIYYVTDNGSNMVKALKECVTEYAPLIQATEINEEDIATIQLYEESDPNLDTSFIENEVDCDLAEFERYEEDCNEIFETSKRLPCVAHQVC